MRLWLIALLAWVIAMFLPTLPHEDGLPKTKPGWDVARLVFDLVRLGPTPLGNRIALALALASNLLVAAWPALLSLCSGRLRLPVIVIVLAMVAGLGVPFRVAPISGYLIGFWVWFAAGFAAAVAFLIGLLARRGRAGS